MRWPMELHQVRLVGFAAGALIVGLQTILIARQCRNARGAERRKVIECGLFCLVTFFWQFGNFADEATHTVNFDPASDVFRWTYLIRRVALYMIPLSLSYLSPLFEDASGLGSWLSRLGRAFRAVLWPWTVMLVAFQIASFLGWADNPRLVSIFGQTSVRLILVFLILFMIQSLLQIRVKAGIHRKQVQIANLVGLAVCLAGAVVLVTADWMNSGTYIRVGTMVTLTTVGIAVAYRQYQFPFMDTFILHATSGVLMLSFLVTGVAVGTMGINPGLQPLSFVAFAVLLIYTKEPLTRWVERVLMGFDESVEAQENRIGSAIRALMRDEEFGEWVGRALPAELTAQWAAVGSQRRHDAALAFEVPGSQSLWLSIGRRTDGRPYMSRQLRLGQTTALQLAAQYERVVREDLERKQLINQHELREVTSRAQIQALQSQIRPHFLFNTLNVLSNLIHTDARKAEDLTEELAAVFRYTLDATRTEWVSVEEEVRFVTSYLRIEKARFEGRLEYNIEMQPGTGPILIPPMILQPVVENAVKHGVSSRTEGGVVTVRAKAEAGQLILAVEDRGKGVKSEENFHGQGIGLKNVRERLTHVYRDQAALDFITVGSEGARVILTMPQFVETPA
jgi:hypothetical protein